MKKSVLSLSIAAVLAGFGGSAMAAPGDKLELNPEGVGHILLVPYFTTQGGNTTMINLTNTDTVHGKAVKVRFRSASNSDDIFDFQVLLSPGGVFPMSLSASADGGTTITTSTEANPDITCTKPWTTDVAGGVNNKTFGTTRVNGDIAQTREGYVEIFNMGDIKDTTTVGDLYDAVLHSTAAASRCTGDAWKALDLNTTKGSAGLVAPTTGLMANWGILNVAGAGAAWGGAATAIQANDSNGIATAGNIVYWPQSKAEVTLTAGLDTETADPLLIKATFKPLMQDLPDLSTPYLVGSTTASVQALAVSAALATSSITNEFLTGSGVGATTDFVFSMPTRRYSVAYDYTGATEATALLVNTKVADYFKNGVNLAVDLVAKQICVKNITYEGWDREENVTKSPTDIVVSPAVTDPATPFCGETSVLAVNRGVSATLPTGALQAKLAIRGLDVSSVAPTSGWITLSTPGATTKGLPILGSAFVSASTGTAFVGSAWPHRTILTGAAAK